MNLLVIGAGRGLDQIKDAISHLDYDLPAGLIRIVGTMDDAGDAKVDAAEAGRMKAYGQIDYAVISVSTSIEFRERVFNEFLVAGVPFFNIIHPTAYVSPEATIGTGNVILAQCHIGTHAIIGSNNFISAKCSLEHHNDVGSHNTFGPGVMTSSRVKIGNRNRFGTGVFIEPGVEIGDDCLIGSGSVLTYNQKIEDNHVLKTHVASYPKERE